MKRSLFKKGHRDANEQQILDLLNARNVRYTMLAPGDGADLIVWIAPIEAWEIKNADQPPSKRRLTDDEKELLEYCTHARIPYVVIETQDDANDRLNKYFERI